VFELRKKLDRAVSRLAQAPGSAGALSRETELEKDLEAAQNKCMNLRHEKKSLEMTIRELQMRLTEADSAQLMAAGSSLMMADSLSPAARQNRPREKDLEEQLVKAKKDKDKAIRVLIQIIGKEKVNDFLTKNAGNPDILDALLANFSSTATSSSTTSEGRGKASPSPRKNKAAGLGAGKSPAAAITPARNKYGETTHVIAGYSTR